jgi:hypothetical protein
MTAARREQNNERHQFQVLLAFRRAAAKTQVDLFPDEAAGAGPFVLINSAW